MPVKCCHDNLSIWPGKVIPAAKYHQDHNYNQRYSKVSPKHEDGNFYKADHEDKPNKVLFCCTQRNDVMHLKSGLHTTYVLRIIYWHMHVWKFSNFKGIICTKILVFAGYPILKTQFKLVSFNFGDLYPIHQITNLNSSCYTLFCSTYHSCISPRVFPVAMHGFWGWQSTVVIEWEQR
jgi:hypothetical protein